MADPEYASAASPAALDKMFESERERMHRQMLSSVSHDLKTPLATIIGSLEIHGRMQHMLTEEKRTQLIITALQEAYRLDNFVTNILDMAKLENGMVKVRREISDVGLLLKDCVEKSSHRFYSADVKKMDIKLVPPGRDVSIDTDPALFCRLVGLLIDNAIKHGGADCKVRLNCKKEGVKLIAQVTDNGPGIPQGKNEEIFSKYTRIARLDHQNAGTGLGLSIARAIAVLLGGTLSAQNGEDGGAVFTLELTTS